MTTPRTVRQLLGPTLLYALTVVVVLVVGLLIASGPTAIDSAVMESLESERSAGLTSFASGLSTVFSPVLVPVWALIVAGLLLWRDRRLERAATVLASVAGAAAVAEVLKLIVGRSRPPAADQLPAYEAALSYPSGHVTGTAALLISVAIVFTRDNRSARIAALAAALGMTIIVAWTRLYLGVHWFTDVTAAIVIGGSTALFGAVVVPRVVESLTAIYTRKVSGSIRPAGQTQRIGALSDQNR
jgi:membrane-associated phospholipid phosphatase